MDKQIIRLTEQDLHRIVKESVESILKEIGDTNRGMYMLGRTQQRAIKRGDRATDDAISDRYERNYHGMDGARAFHNGYNDQASGNKEQIARRSKIYQNQ